MKTPPRLHTDMSAASASNAGGANGSGTNTSGGNSNLPVTNYYIFIVGGMTWSEIRSVYEVIQSTRQSGDPPIQIYIGSTHVLTPSSFMKDLAALPS